MRKVLILALLLGIAPLASAGIINLSLTSGGNSSVAIGTTAITVQLKADQDLKTITNIDFTSTSTNVIQASGYGWLVGESATTGDGTQSSNLIDDAYMGSLSIVTAGTVLYEFDVMPAVVGTIGIADMGVIPDPYADPFANPPDPDNYVIGNLTGLNVVPEPATIALLGLGGLLLRRRR